MTSAGRVGVGEQAASLHAGLALPCVCVTLVQVGTLYATQQLTQTQTDRLLVSLLVGMALNGACSSFCCRMGPHDSSGAEHTTVWRMLCVAATPTVAGAAAVMNWTGLREPPTHAAACVMPLHMLCCVMQGPCHASCAATHVVCGVCEVAGHAKAVALE